LFWIKELGTAMPYGCNDNIKGVGNLSSPGGSEINVMSLFNTIPRTKRFRSNWFEKTTGRHVTYNTRQSVLRRKRIYASFVKSKIILNRKEIVKEIPPYFKNQSVPIVSYSYTNSIGRKIFNYKEALQDINKADRTPRHI
jgi:hypothetical protein